jgi:hypothetical protein
VRSVKLEGAATTRCGVKPRELRKRFGANIALLEKENDNEGQAATEATSTRDLIRLLQPRGRQPLVHVRRNFELPNLSDYLISLFSGGDLFKFSRKSRYLLGPRHTFNISSSLHGASPV